jgi:hypothetical protein
MTISQMLHANVLKIYPSTFTRCPVFYVATLPLLPGWEEQERDLFPTSSSWKPSLSQPSAQLSLTQLTSGKV